MSPWKGLFKLLFELKHIILLITRLPTKYMNMKNLSLHYLTNLPVFYLRKKVHYNKQST